MRFRWYRQVEENGWTMKEAHRVFGISEKTYYKWYRRDHGLGSNTYKNRAEHPQKKIKGRVRAALVEAKGKYNYGPKKMRIYPRQETGVDVWESAIYKFMKKRRLIRKPQRKQKWHTPLKEPYVAGTPGENVQLDVKYVPGGRGERMYQFRFIDTVSRMRYAYDSYAKDARSTITAFHGAMRYFRKHFVIAGIQTDNGGEFRGVFHEYLVRTNIAQRYIPKRSSPWNGTVERANRSVDDEFYLNPGKPWKTLRQYVHWYNYDRPHLGKNMNGLTPHQKLLSLAA